MTTAAPSPRARIRGALLGLAAGDAVGTTVEFRPPGTFPPVTDMTGGGPFHLPPGAWTDDTSMALCLAESLVERGTFDALDQMRRYVRWFREGHLSSTGRCFDIGNTVRAALDRFQATGDPYAGSMAENTAGNGSLMRLAPAPLFFLPDADEAIRRAADSSRTTHATAVAVDACRYLAALLVAAVNGATKEALTTTCIEPRAGYWREHPLHPVIAAIADGSFRAKDPPAIRGSGYAAHSLEAALWAFRRGRDFREGCLLAVNLGDDADTTAAVYGQLAGAFYGEDGIPSEWRERLVMRDVIERLADAIADHVEGPRQAPRAPPIPNSYWIREGELAAGEYPGHWNRARTRERIGAILDAGVRVFVDLTEDRDGLEPYDDALHAESAHRGVEAERVRLPVPDMGVPSAARMREVLDRIDAEVAAGRPVYVHCWGGVGRTGTVVGCHLVRHGESCDEALARVGALFGTMSREKLERHPEGSPQTTGQREFVKGWSDEQGARPA